VSDTQNNSAARLRAGANDNINSKKLRHRQWGGAAVGLLLGLGGLIAGRLGQLYPHFDVFAQFSVQFMAAVAGFAIAIFFTRFKTFIGIALTLALLVLYGAWPHVVSSPLLTGPFAMQSDEKLLRVAHFNTLAVNLKYAAIAAEVLRIDADVVSLIEMNFEKKVAVLPALKAVYPYSYDCAGTEYCELVIVSKYPIVSADGNGHWVGAPYARVVLGGAMTGVTFVGVHTTRFPQSRAQLKQVHELVRKLENVTGDLIVMGDFNATPYSRITTTLEQGANVKRLTDLPTWPTHMQLPQLAIDHAFASKNFRVIGNQQIGEAAGSDHYPIVLTLARKTTP
jgi:endonuclease/exonuclease/phosphatase (EEP) superfamily protein YafD